MIHGDYPEFVAASGLDSVTQYELWKAIWSGLNDHNLFELGHALGRHNGFLETFAPLTFVGNHDVTRLASQLEDDRHLAHALAVLLTVGGTPAIYYGDEQAFRGIKEERAGGDDEIRPGFPGAPDELAPTGWPVYRLHQDLIGLRRRHPWLYRAQTEMLHLAGEQMIYRVARRGRGGDGGEQTWWWRSAWRTRRSATGSRGPGRYWPARGRWPAPGARRRRSSCRRTAGRSCPSAAADCEP